MYLCDLSSSVSSISVDCKGARRLGLEDDMLVGGLSQEVNSERKRIMQKKGMVNGENKRNYGEKHKVEVSCL